MRKLAQSIALSVLVGALGGHLASPAFAGGITGSVPGIAGSAPGIASSTPSVVGATPSVTSLPPRVTPRVPSIALAPTCRTVAFIDRDGVIITRRQCR